MASKAAVRKARDRWKRAVLRGVGHTDEDLIEQHAEALARGDKAAARAIFKQIRDRKIEAIARATEDFVDAIYAASIVKPRGDPAP